MIQYSMNIHMFLFVCAHICTNTCTNVIRAYMCVCSFCFELTIWMKHPRNKTHCWWLIWIILCELKCQLKRTWKTQKYHTRYSLKIRRERRKIQLQYDMRFLVFTSIPWGVIRPAIQTMKYINKIVRDFKKKPSK